MYEYYMGVFVIDDDWEGKFDFLKKEGCDVACMLRMSEISSSQMKDDLGRVGGGYGNKSYGG